MEEGEERRKVEEILTPPITKYRISSFGLDRNRILDRLPR
jgi:hypothetical protein